VTALILALALAQVQPKEVTIVEPRTSTHCDRLRTDAKFKVRFQNAEPTGVFQMISDATCFTFVVEKGLKAKVSIHRVSAVR
jgi:hypothetical protein